MLMKASPRARDQLYQPLPPCQPFIRLLNGRYFNNVLPVMMKIQNIRKPLNLHRLTEGQPNTC
jgi:hypothetical protein